MIRGLLIAFAFFSPLFFPVGFVGVLTFLAAIFSPLTPLAVGLMLDFLYYSPGAYLVPFFTFIGLLGAIVATLVRRFVETSIIR